MQHVLWGRTVPWGFSLACQWWCWSSTAHSLLPHSKSTLHVETTCSKQSLPPLLQMNRNSSSPGREKRGGVRERVRPKVQGTLQRVPKSMQEWVIKYVKKRVGEVEKSTPYTPSDGLNNKCVAIFSKAHNLHCTLAAFFKLLLNIQPSVKVSDS